jgi:hypothetical protein
MHHPIMLQAEQFYKHSARQDAANTDDTSTSDIKLHMSNPRCTEPCNPLKEANAQSCMLKQQ